MTVDQAHVLLVLALGLFLAPLVAARVRIPVAVAEMLYGAVVAGLVPSLHHLPAFATFVQRFGFLFVLFLAGMELDTHDLLARGWGALLRAVPFGIAVPVGATLVATLLGRPPVLGLIVGTVSIGLSSRLLADMGLLRTRLGQIVVLTGGIGEVVTIICIAVLSNAASSGDRLRVLLSVGALVAMFLAGLLVIGLLRDLAWWQPRWFAPLVSDDSAELGLRSAIVLLSLFAVAAVLLDVPDALGAFVAGQALGIVFPLRRPDDAGNAVAVLRGKLRSVGFSFFLPVAFI